MGHVRGDSPLETLTEDRAMGEWLLVTAFLVRVVKSCGIFIFVFWLMDVPRERMWKQGFANLQGDIQMRMQYFPGNKGYQGQRPFPFPGHQVDAKHSLQCGWPRV